MNISKSKVKYIVLIGMFSAVSFVAVLIGRLVPNVAGFLSYDPKDAVITIAGFIMGPLASLIITVLVSLIEMFTISTTGVYGLIMNIFATLAFALPAVIIYKKVKHSRAGALIGLIAGVLLMTGCMVAWNYIITPFYMGVPREMVASMLVPTFLPFNLAKGFINGGITFLLYKPIVNALRKAKLVAPSENQNKTGINIGLTILAAAVVVTFVIVLVIMIRS